MKTNLGVNVPLSIVAGQPAPKAKANRQNNLMTTLSGQYANLSTDQKALWNLANNFIQTPTDPNNNDKRGTNGWTLYYANSVALLDAEQPLTKTPAVIAQPENIPPMRVDAHYLNNTPVITLIPNVPYAAGPTIIVWATPVVPLGNGSSTKFLSRAYRKIGTIVGGIPASGVNVADKYLSVFPSVPKSCKIGFKLQAVNPGGYHSVKEYVVGVTPQLSAADFGLTATDDNDLQLAMGE